MIAQAIRQATAEADLVLLVGGTGAGRQDKAAEALGAGVLRTHLSHYQPVEYHLVRTGAVALDRSEVVAFSPESTSDAVR